jgi:hypothetical protein
MWQGTQGMWQGIQHVSSVQLMEGKWCSGRMMGAL